MSIFSVKKTNTASASLLLALSLVLVSGLSTMAVPKSAPTTRIANHNSRNHISPPHAGVKLLEDILTRMRSLPQIAMSRNKQTFQYQGTQVTEKSSGATNQLLAIRPKENASKAKADNLRQIAMAPPSYLNEMGKDREERDSRTLASVGSAVGGGAGGDGLNSQKQKKSSEAKAEPLARSQSNSAAGGRPGARFNFAPSAYKMEVPTVKPSPSPSNGISVYPASDAFSSVGTEGYGNLGASTKEITDRLSPEARRRLAGSTSKLFDVAKKMEEAQTYMDKAGKQSAAGSSVARGAILADKHTSQRADIKKISSGQLLANTPSGSSRIWSADDDAYGMANDKGRIITQAAPAQVASPESPAPQKPPAEPSIYKHVREFLGTKGQSEAESAERSKPIEIALLPPSVVTGIPLVRLGTSETESNKALSSKGSINKTKINDWSVWSLQKPGAEDVSLQIYVRNGAVEAIRIFDSSLISPDFGVKLGDDLGAVKHKFGEPAFILSEPQSRAGQNYVYPISQVSFQLAYTSKTTPPKVVSLLIFNAK
ncbi:MAG: hypothetical protein IAF58_20520 [Leptolyngbya sp.]|nr:hypothetical protein [Candidatus Melainabacteria bacterium]